MDEKNEGFVGELTPAEIDADRKANAEQETRPSIVVERGRNALRAADKGQKK